MVGESALQDIGLRGLHTIQTASEARSLLIAKVSRPHEVTELTHTSQILKNRLLICMHWGVRVGHRGKTIG